MSEASVIIDGVRSPLLEFGSPGLDEAVVFVHGNPGSSLDWERLASKSIEARDAQQVQGHLMPTPSRPQSPEFYENAGDFSKRSTFEVNAASISSSAEARPD